MPYQNNSAVPTMKKRTLPIYRTIACFCVIFLVIPVAGLSAPSPCTDKIVIGQTCWVQVEELDIRFLARIDTGATSTSLHAVDFLIHDESSDPRDNVGKEISFMTETRDGEVRRLSAEIVRVQTVTSAQGREKRYMVQLTLTTSGITKNILVNLRDRSRMRYKLLVGRDWLTSDFLVDVDWDETLLAEEGEEE